ncbi:DOMON domain-containingprotein [Purpureocillium lavendulum]|uniref:DOMON domain-containingprotein n=1 Tax=Purpureocillium lavendulum TaxID=1247861 RepID=A0AB34G796_9HYPO|nr:DOMON domain-containingprotein [Purpureocillium lavendulum]
MIDGRELQSPAAAAAAAAQGARAGTRVQGEPTPYCPVNDVCFQFAVPEAAASSGSGSVYFQLQARSTVRWAGLGIGQQMSGATMFVMYADGKNNVTLSTRKATGHIEPEYSRMSNVELLEGSGIVNGSMVANVRCRGCDKLDLSGVSGWLAAWKRGDAMNDESPSAEIEYHDSHNVFNVNLGRATVSTDANPFLNPQNSTGGTPGSTPGGNSGGNSGGIVETGGSGGPSTQTLISAHGILMTIVFVVGFPIGAMLSPFVGSWVIHASWQTFIFLGMWAGFALGIVICGRLGFFFQNTHTQLGVFVVSLMGLQPILGFLHHMYYMKHRSRGVISYLHIWYGRALIILGVINGGLGLQLAGNPQPFVNAYIAVAAIVAAAYLALSAFAFCRVKKRVRNGQSGTDFVQELYLKELKAYKAPPVKESDSEGQVQTFAMPKTPASPEETDLAGNLKEYESMAVEIEGQDASAQAGTQAPALPDWLEAEEEEPQSH